MLKKKQEKTREEKSAEGFFPVDQDDLKNTTEKTIKELAPQKILGKIEKRVKEVIEEEFLQGAVEKQVKKRPSFSEIETVEKKGTKKKRIYKKKTPKKKPKKRATTEKVKYSPPKIQLQKNGYELIITEKPQAAAKIAEALGKSVKRNVKGVPYYEVNREGEKIVVASAVGHLFTLKQNTKGYNVPRFDISWVPNYLARKKDFTKRYYDVLLKLAKDAGSLTVATDFDVEGEVIGWNVVRFICNQADAKRMKFSTLTDTELNNAYDNKLQTLEWGQAIAGETRHYLDWFYGINLSRALMNAIKSTGKFKIMSIGRVQGPTLNLIVQKEREIQAFKSEPYWQTFIKVDDDKNKLELKHIKDIFNEKELDKFKGLKGKTAIADTKKTQQVLPPNPPFNLTTLQTEAYKFHGITPSNTLRAAQKLYLAGLISYPRTSSQELPESIKYKPILKKLAKEYKVEKLITKTKPIQGKKKDPAHPSIYPTGNKQILSGDEEKIYNLIVRRFLSLFCDNAIIDNKRITAEVDKLRFSTRGSEISKKAWLDIYPSKMKEIDIPDMGGEVKIINSRTEEKETQPPKRYSPASILSTLEKKNLGTKATRASILETLYDRGYIQGTSVTATPLGISLIETLEKHSPIIIDEKLTRNFEDQMENITGSKGKDLYKEEQKILEKAKDTITEISEQMIKKEKQIGKELVEANTNYREQQKKENTMNVCPVCKKGNLHINYSKKNHRYFVACDAYPDCRNTYTLPPNGVIKKADKLCEECGWPMTMRLSKGKRPWVFCFNPDCTTNKERVDEYKKKQAE